MKALTITIALAACSIGPATWGEAANEISTAHCEAVLVCWPDLFDLDECVRHSDFHACGLAGTCGRLISDRYVEQIDECVADIPEHDCALLLRGSLPESCSGWEG